MIIDRSPKLVQVLVCLLTDSEHRGIRSYGDSGQIIAYLRQHPDEGFFLEPSLRNDRPLPETTEFQLSDQDVLIGAIRYDSAQNRVVCG